MEGAVTDTDHMAAETGEDAILVHDAERRDPSLAFALARLADRPTGPTPIGVFRSVQRDVYGDAMERQLQEATNKLGPGDLEKLLYGGDTWTVS